MSRINEPENLESLAFDEAADWLLKIEADPSIGVSDIFEKWLMTSPANLNAYNKVQETWEATASLHKASDIQDLIQPIAANENTKPAPTRRGLLIGSIAGLAACLVASAIVFNASTQTEITQTYQSDIGQIAHFTLPDNTILTLDSDSSVVINQNNSERRITLNHGRLFVDVSHDKNRPFIVEASETTFTALGTSYSVFKNLDQTSLEVYDGVVRFQQGTQTPLTAKAGMGIQSQNQSAPRIYQINALANKKPMWTEDRVTFDNIALSSAISVFSRYTSKNIEIAEPDLRDHKISGAFALTDLPSFIQSVELITKSQAIETDDNITITSKN